MISHRPFALRSLLVLFALCALPFATYAQTATATLSGTVVDQNGAVVPGTDVTIINTGTGLQRQVTTNDEGYFTVPLLPPSTYSVRAQHTGFSPVEIQNVVLNVGDQKALKIELKAGDVNATVQVTSEAPLINESPAVATVVDRQFVGNLPLNGRSFQSLILLTPGVVIARSDSQSNPGQFSVNGQRTNANYFTVDGVSANFGASSANQNTRNSQEQAGAVPGFTALGTTGNLVSIDALEEFRIQTSSYSAEFGRQPGGQVQLITRSGTNDYHGTLFDYIRNEIFDANNWFTNSIPLTAQEIAQGIKKKPRAPLRQNQFGGTFSGPVLLPRLGEGGKPFWTGRNKTFFFFSYEGLRLLLPTTRVTVVPSLRLRQLASSGIRPLLDIFPLPTGPETTNSSGIPTGFAPFVGSYSSPKSLNATSIRIDQVLNRKLALFGRYNEAPSESLTRSVSFLSGETNRTRTITLGSTLSIDSQLSNEFRVNYSSNRSTFTSTMDTYGGAIVVDASQMVSGYSGPGPSRGSISVQLPGNQIAPSLGDFADSSQRQINVVDNLSLVKGAHQLKFGVDYRRLTPIYGPVAYQEDNIFRSETEISSGRAFAVVITANKGARPVFDNFSLYAEDTWKRSRRLTINLGVRWELNPAPHDADGRKPVLVCGVENIVTATLCPSNVPFYKTFYKTLAPRFGVAYQLFQAKGRETILRGGFGIYYDMGNGQSTAGFGGFPFSASAILLNVPFPLPSTQAVQPVFSTVTLPTSQTLYALNSNLKLPYTMDWNISVEQSLGMNQAISLSYVAAASRNLLTTQRINQRVGGTGPRPNANFGQINYTSHGPSSNYQSLQAQFQRRLSQGLQIVANYTWSHAIDEISNEVDFGTLVRGNADFDVRHNFKVGLTYNLPRIKAGRLITPLIRDWAVDSTAYAQSGQPTDIFAGFNIRDDGTQINVRPDLIEGVPIWVGDPKVPGGRRINRAAFQLPPLVTGTSFFSRQGSLGRNVVILPGVYQLNIALRRQFSLFERLKLQLKAEAFNIFNHPLFGQYEKNVQLSSFGTPSTTLNSNLGGLNSLYQIGGQRSLQFSARLFF